ncbi:hypothetical protein Tco_1030388 [Tanacetum coccineum]|uniref:Uncharacterized protein n=1 Tax=Tanacetum coccineum TaxID=301880 RepID=A0ABQ5G632_9ASTR
MQFREYRVFRMVVFRMGLMVVPGITNRIKWEWNVVAATQTRSKGMLRIFRLVVKLLKKERSRESNSKLMSLICGVKADLDEN